jgi:hypothetical protein
MTTVSIIIAGNGSRTPLRRSLDQLLAQSDENVQIIAAFGDYPGLVRDLGTSAASVELISLAQAKPLHVLRGRALPKATGEIIAILDPYSIPSSCWIETLRATHRRHDNQAIGGPVELDGAASRNLRDWAIYINEYGMFLPPMAKQELELLPGCNVAYKRAALFDGTRPRFDELWKTFVNDQLRDVGDGLLIEPDLIVALDKSIALTDYLFTRFDHGRCYGAMSSEGMPLASRIVRILAAPVLPPLLLLRWARRYWSRGRFRSKLIATLPLQLLMFSWWVAGETVGRVFGSGQSCDRLYY